MKDGDNLEQTVQSDIKTAACQRQWQNAISDIDSLRQLMNIGDLSIVLRSIREL